MQDATKIEDVKFAKKDGSELIPTQSYMTPFGEIYIAFKTTDGCYFNVSSKDVKNYVVGSFSPKYPL